MNQPSRSFDPFEELHFALAEGVAEDLPSELGTSMVAAALAARTPGRPVDQPAPITPAEGFRRAARSLDTVLNSLTEQEWRCAAIRGLDVQGLIGHLIGVEQDFLRALAEPGGPQADADHVVSTDPVATEQSGRQPSDTHRSWRAAVADTFTALEDIARSPERGQDAVALYGLRMALDPILIVRTFELWTHEEDIRRATGRPLAAPDAATLALMTALGVAMLPSGLARIRPGDVPRTARIVLTGAGGGTWQTSLTGDRGSSPTDGAPVDVRIVVDAVDFCRLLANRIDPTSLAAVVSGDGALARDVFTGAATLALD